MKSSHHTGSSCAVAMDALAVNVAMVRICMQQDPPETETELRVSDGRADYCIQI